ncbi:DNA-processing protein DprA [Altibacter sp. HG106]|uniref:DNA-processing protein DprA n=1 Tax=Altibacter sp. HG106 TaxID=3023937 RepID=UPI00300FA58A
MKTPLQHFVRMLSESELLYALALQRVPNLGDTSAKKLLRTFGSSEAIFKSKREALLKIEGIGPHRLKGLQSSKLLHAAEREIKYLQRNRIQAFYFLDSEYPENLRHCPDGPLLLFSKGTIQWNTSRILSIVGTRQATQHGKEFCQHLIEALSPLQPIIVSGFAYGIDIIAHRAAMDAGLQTVACLAHGFEQWYPKPHQKYVTPLCENGGFLTEFWSDAPFERTNFLRRNRIIAGISEATIVIESAEKGGSLVTADIAHSYGRELFAVPGRVNDSQSVGCHQLIKRQYAHMLTQPADVPYVLQWDVQRTAPKQHQTSLFVSLTADEETIYSFLSASGRLPLDEIALGCKVATSKTATLLLQLELKGKVRPLPGKCYEAC